MKKCKNCGTDFEGNCCPKCGTWADGEKTCPKCGAKLRADDSFCSKCGFSFDNKKNDGGKIAKIGKWIKSHLKIVIPFIIAVVVVIVLSCTIPACIKAKANGTYYKITGDGEIDKETYIVLNSGKWSNEDDEGGTYEIDGEKITFYEEFFGETDVSVGTFKDYVIILEEGGKYISEKHNHNYGKWKTESEASCISNGIKRRTCDCGYAETEFIPSTGHDTFYNFDETGHWYECKVCNQTTTEKSAHTGTECSVCGYPLHYTLNTETNSYRISGVMSGITEIVIPSTYNNLPVTAIDSKAFENCNSLQIIRYNGDISSWCKIDGLYNLMTKGSSNRKLYIDGNEITGNLIIPIGVTYIDRGAFYNCNGLMNVTIPDSVVSIDKDAFYGCTNLIQTEDGVYYVDKWVIGCEDYASNLSIKNNTRGIAADAFSNKSLKSITIPDSVTHIGAYAFYGCGSLTSVTVGNGVTYVGTFAFYECRQLQYNEYNNALYLGNDSNPYVILMEAKDQDITDCTVNEKTKVIYDDAFYFCNLTSVTIPDSINSIGNDAFRGCSKLKDLNFKGTKAQWTAIKKGQDWNYDIYHCTIHCTDGDY